MSDFSLSDTSVRVRLSPMGDLSWPRLATWVPAVARSSDEQLKVRFDAVSWFEAASDEELVALASRYFGYSPEATAVARFCAAEVPLLAELVAYAAATRDWDGRQVECEVELDVPLAERWLEENRPHVIPWLRGECLFATPHYQVSCYEMHDEGTPLGKTWEVHGASRLDVRERFVEERGQTLEDAILAARRLEAAVYELSPGL